MRPSPISRGISSLPLAVDFVLDSGFNIFQKANAERELGESPDPPGLLPARVITNEEHVRTTKVSNMSLTSLANREISSRETTFLQNRMKPEIAEQANMLISKFEIPSTKLHSLTMDLMPLATKTPVEPTKASNALESLSRYIPTESVTLYIAACSAASALKDKLKPETSGWIYWGFVILTPLLFLIIFIGMRRSADLPALPPIPNWPWWKLFASTVAFAVWALAVPGSPYLNGEVGGVIAAFLAVFVSTFLTLLEPVFQSRA